jgi:hypothetical protein
MRESSWSEPVPVQVLALVQVLAPVMEPVSWSWWFLVVVVVGVVAGGLAVDRLGAGIPVLVGETAGSVAERVAVARADRLGAPVGNPLPVFPPPPQPDKSRAEAAIITPTVRATIFRSARQGVA